MNVVHVNSQQPLAIYEGNRKHILSLETVKAQRCYPLIG